MHTFKLSLQNIFFCDHRLYTKFDIKNIIKLINKNRIMQNSKKIKYTNIHMYIHFK